MFAGHFAQIKPTFEYYSPYSHQMQDIFTFTEKEFQQVFSAGRFFRNGVLIRNSHGAKTIKNAGYPFVQPARKYLH